VPPQCISAHAERAEGGAYLIWVDAINPIIYTLFDGEGYLSFDEQPIPIEGLVTGVVYKVFVGGTDTGCEFSLEPTALPTNDQPNQKNFQTALPFLGR
jgi:hypothetical protein